MLKTRQEEVIDVGDWDVIVQHVYNRPYNFQQQDDCKERQRVTITIPDVAYDFENDNIPETVDTNEMGVSFKAWLERDPKQKLQSHSQWDIDYGLEMWWERNFYPNVQMIANDLYKKGLINSGKYIIDIDW